MDTTLEQSDSPQIPTPTPSQPTSIQNISYQGPVTKKTIIAFFLGVLIGIGCMWVYQNLPLTSPKENLEVAVSPSKQPASTTALILPTNWQTYKSQLFPLEFNYPQQITIEPTMSGNAEMLILTQQDTASAAAKQEIATIQVLQYEDTSSTEDLRSIDNLKGLYPYDYRDEKMKLANVEARIFSGYTHKSSDGNFTDFGIYAFLWNKQNQVSFVVQLKNKNKFSEKDAHLLVNSVRFLEGASIKRNGITPTIIPDEELITETPIEEN